jgi:dolichol-phosphate mannosyltransferase
MIVHMVKKISVVVPVYFNALSLSDLLKRLDQIKNELAKISLDLEVVAVDDGSKDNSFTTKSS